MSSERPFSADTFPAPPVGLEEMLSGIARGLVSAQGQLDRAARETVATTSAVPDGEVHLRPLWFVFQRTSIDLELSTFVAKGAQLQCRMLDPVAVALRGYSQSSGTKVRIEIAPLGSDLFRRE
jgi:hypothetical protein